MSEKDKLENLRHSASHLLAAAVLKLWPKTKHAIGPAIEDGFYYDFDFGETKITQDDLENIEKEMHKIVKSWDGFEKIEVSAKEAKEKFKDNPYKKELIEELDKEGKKITLYKSGDFIDLCGGGHTQDPSKNLKYFKLLSIAGAYWRGSEKNTMLTRIYGTAFFKKDNLDKYLENRKMAEEINHRKLGKELELFAIFEEIGQGLPVWLPRGYKIRRILENYMIELEEKYGYKHILTPHISKSELFEISGHLNFYKDSMYAPMEIDEKEYYLKPMNCPAAMMVYNNKPRSYKDLPIKLGELGTVYRYEKSGELHGLQRVRGFTQNDAHIFCTPEQLESQIKEVLEMMEVFFKAVGFDKYKYRLSLSDPDDKEKAKKYAGSKKDWEYAENTLKKVLDETNKDYDVAKGEAVFYGPKIDVQAVNVFGKEDSISTVQLDFNLPERFSVTYVDKKGEEKAPFVIHRALIGSFERFFAFFIEHHRGAFPVWLSPTQVKILPLTERNVDYASILKEQLEDHSIRVEIDEKDETLQSKIRNAQLEKVPYMIIVGDKEEQNKTISLRLRTEEDLGVMKLEDFVKRISKNVEEKSLDL
jgi:threonyl-tRNA synthetase